jgi:hypothetical protein
VGVSTYRQASELLVFVHLRVQFVDSRLGSSSYSSVPAKTSKLMIFERHRRDLARQECFNIDLPVCREMHRCIGDYTRDAAAFQAFRESSLRAAGAPEHLISAPSS